MANTYKNIVITPNIDSDAANVPFIRFSGGDATSNTDINVRVYTTQSGTLSFEGSAGQLFSITNDLTNTIFSVNDVSGIPSLEIDAAGLIKLAEFGGNVAIGRSNASHKLDIVGTANASNILVNGNMVFTPANDGAGSNMDADFLDGQHGSYYGISSDVSAANRVANAAFLHANAVFAAANADYAFSNSAHSIANLAFVHANAAHASANAGMAIGNGAFASANAGQATANAAFTRANNSLLSSSYTAADVLAKLITVDGAGTTLDADFLDGQHGSYYGISTDVSAANRVANAAFLHANAAFATVNSAFGVTNTAVQNTASITFAGNSVFAIHPVFSGDSWGSSNLVVRNQSGFYETSYGTTANGWPVDTGSWQHAWSVTHSNDANYFAMQMASSFFAQDWYLRNTNNVGTAAWSKIWHNNNDGAGSTLDADFLDGQHGSYYGIATDVTAAFTLANNAYLHANAAFASANAGQATANVALARSNTIMSSGNAAFDQANTARVHANTAHITANAAFLHANAGYAFANSIAITANLAFVHANAVFAAANADYAFSNSAHSIANLAFVHANAAFAKANTGGGGGASNGKSIIISMIFGR